MNQTFYVSLSSELEGWKVAPSSHHMQLVHYIYTVDQYLF
jgi:hypothetical protein